MLKNISFLELFSSAEGEGEDTVLRFMHKLNS